MISNLEEYFEQIERLTRRADWKSAEALAKLLSISDSHAKERSLHLEEYGSKTRRERVSDVEFDELTCLHLHVLHSIHVTHNMVAAHSTQVQMIQTFNKEVLKKRKDENWFLPVFYQISTDLRLLAKEADAVAAQDDEGESAVSFFETSANCLMESFRTCVTERAESRDTKRVAILNMTNQLFRIYFKINKLNLLTPLIRTIENSESMFHEFSMADKVTYYYFLGRKAMFDANLNLAEKSLSYAFRNCPVECKSNKRRILVYLIPVKMFLGHMPSRALLHKYELDEFQEVVEAVKEGNLDQLDRALSKNEKFFIQCGIFLMLEKLRLITFRTLFKKVCKIVGGHIFALDAFLSALNFVGVKDVDLDELECIIANLIATKKIKGYISHQHSKLVVSKDDPFPALSTISV